MKSFELQPTYENLYETFMEDTINRGIDVQRFVSILNLIEDSCSIALDGYWGSGKTFFVKQVKMVLDSYNDFILCSNVEDSDRIKKRGQQLFAIEQTEVHPQVSVYYDAWANDNDEDPILSLIYEILQSIKTEYSFKKGTDCLRLAGGIVEFFSGKKVNAILDSLKTEDPLLSLKKDRDIHTLIEDFLESLLIEQGDRLVIFIDELDRCKPSYAVQLLERIKHYFSNDRITFVFSININELQHTIRHYYGNAFNAGKYLDRFFDLRISLPPANISRYYQHIGLENDSWLFDMICKEVINIHHFELREIAKFYRLAKAAAYKPTHSNSYNFAFSNGKAVHFCLTCVVPIMIGLKLSDPTRYTSFIQGRDSSPLHEVLDHDDLVYGTCTPLLLKNETYGPQKSEQDVPVKLKDKLNQVYNALFVQDFISGAYEVKVGELSFSKSTREDLFRTVSLLSKYADFKG